MGLSKILISRDNDSESFSESLESALCELKNLSSSCPSLVDLKVHKTLFRAEFVLDGTGSQGACLHVAGLAADVASRGKVTGIRFIVEPLVGTARFEMIF